MHKQHYDLIAIGGGGLAVAEKAGAYGKKVAILEAGSLGGRDLLFMVQSGLMCALLCLRIVINTKGEDGEEEFQDTEGQR